MTSIRAVVGFGLVCGALGAIAYADSGEPPHGRHPASRADRRACERGDGDACDRSGNALVDSYFSTNSRDDDGARAIVLFQRACDLHSTAGCTDLAWTLMDGIAKQDYIAAERILKTSCDAADAFACSLLADVYDPHGQHPGVASDPKRAVELRRRACGGKLEGLGCSSGCGELATASYYGDPDEGIVEDHVEAARLEQRGCDAGCVNSCFTTGEHSRDGDGLPQSIEAAAARFKSACDAGFAPACVDLGALYVAGAGVKKDHEAALRLFVRSCRLSSGGIEICELDSTGANVRASLARCESGKQDDKDAWICDTLLAASRFGSIGGTVTRGGAPAAHVFVSATGTGASTFTDVNGRFVLAHVPVGAHTVNVRGMAVRTNASASSLTTVTFALDR